MSEAKKTTLVGKVESAKNDTTITVLVETEGSNSADRKAKQPLHSVR